MTRRFPESKLLTTTAKVYIGSIGKRLDNFEMLGVHCEGSFEDFLNKVPSQAEVVVDYSVEKVQEDKIRYSGTALIPKPKKPIRDYTSGHLSGDFNFFSGPGPDA